MDLDRKGRAGMSEKAQGRPLERRHGPCCSPSLRVGGVNRHERINVGEMEGKSPSQHPSSRDSPPNSLLPGRSAVRFRHRICACSETSRAIKGATSRVSIYSCLVLAPSFVRLSSVEPSHARSFSRGVSEDTSVASVPTTFSVGSNSRTDPRATLAPKGGHLASPKGWSKRATWDTKGGIRAWSCASCRNLPNLGASRVPTSRSATTLYRGAVQVWTVSSARIVKRSGGGHRPTVRWIQNASAQHAHAVLFASSTEVREAVREPGRNARLPSRAWKPREAEMADGNDVSKRI